MPRKDRDSPEYRERNRLYQNEWYHRNKESANLTRQKRKADLKIKLREYKSARGCSQCPENHYACLDFHHPEPGTKEFQPAHIIHVKGWSFERMKFELDKLVVLCSNCHRKLHHSADD